MERPPPPSPPPPAPPPVVSFACIAQDGTPWDVACYASQQPVQTLQHAPRGLLLCNRAHEAHELCTHPSTRATAAFSEAHWRFLNSHTIACIVDEHDALQVAQHDSRVLETGSVAASLLLLESRTWIELDAVAHVLTPLLEGDMRLDAHDAQWIVARAHADARAWLDALDAPTHSRSQPPHVVNAALGFEWIVDGVARRAVVPLHDGVFYDEDAARAEVMRALYDARVFHGVPLNLDMCAFGSRASGPLAGAWKRSRQRVSRAFFEATAPVSSNRSGDVRQWVSLIPLTHALDCVDEWFGTFGAITQNTDAVDSDGARDAAMQRILAHLATRAGASKLRHACAIDDEREDLCMEGALQYERRALEDGARFAASLCDGNADDRVEENLSEAVAWISHLHAARANCAARVDALELRRMRADVACASPLVRALRFRRIKGVGAWRIEATTRLLRDVLAHGCDVVCTSKHTIASRGDRALYANIFELLLSPPNARPRREAQPPVFAATSAVVAPPLDAVDNAACPLPVGAIALRLARSAGPVDVAAREFVDCLVARWGPCTPWNEALRRAIDELRRAAFDRRAARWIGKKRERETATAAVADAAPKTRMSPRWPPVDATRRAALMTVLNIDEARSRQGAIDIPCAAEQAVLAILEATPPHEIPRVVYDACISEFDAANIGADPLHPDTAARVARAIARARDLHWRAAHHPPILVVACMKDEGPVPLQGWVAARGVATPIATSALVDAALRGLAPHFLLSVYRADSRLSTTTVTLSRCVRVTSGADAAPEL